MGDICGWSKSEKPNVKYCLSHKKEKLNDWNRQTKTFLHFFLNLIKLYQMSVIIKTKFRSMT